MGLWKLWDLDPAIDYRHCEQAGVFNKEVLCTDWNPHMERISSLNISQFFYYAPNDCLAWYGLMDVAYASGMTAGWRKYRYQFNAEGTGTYEAWDFGPPWFFDMFYMAASTYESGAYGILYGACYFLWGLGVGEVDWTTMLPLSGGWAYSFSGLPNWESFMSFYQPCGLVVNREDGYLALGWNYAPYIYVWKIPENTFVGKVALPGKPLDFAYEDRWRLWAVCEGGYVVKLNYRTLRLEVLSQVAQPDPTDIKYLIAWDSKRGRVAIFRQKPDAADGSCQSTIELYRPIPKVAALTDPVPLKPLRVGQKIPFSFHLVGEAGEGIASYLVEAELTQPTDGLLLGAAVNTREGGGGLVNYQAPASPATETLTLATEITDGEARGSVWEGFQPEEVRTREDVY